MAEQHVCPFWIGYILASPLRKLVQNPQDILQPYVSPGMTVLDFGCAMGFFSLPLAEMVGRNGRVICVDLQQKMLDRLYKRAKMAGLIERIETRVCTNNRFALDDLVEKIDFALVFAVLHEIPDYPQLLISISAALRPQGKLLVSEPRGHVSQKAFDKTVTRIEDAGFIVIGTPNIARSRSVLCQSNRSLTS